MLPIDPFEMFKAKREVERLEKKIRTSALVKCPAPEVTAAAEALAAVKKSKPAMDAFNARSWIY